MDVDLDRDDGSVLDIYLVSRGAICYVTLGPFERIGGFLFFSSNTGYLHMFSSHV